MSQLVTVSDDSISPKESEVYATIDKLAVTSRTIFGSNDHQNKRPVQPEELCRTKRRRTAWEGTLCVVCGDKASGYHYNVLSCEGCKGFYRRVVTDPNKMFICKLYGKCEMDLYWRRKCPACRLKKCKAVGMKPEFVVNKPKTAKLTKKIEKSKVLSHFSVQDRKEFDRRNVDIAEAFTYYRQPIETENKTNTNGPEYVSDVFTVNVQRYVDFCKRIPEYCSLTQQDQITLLKGGVTEASVLRSAQSYADHPDIKPTTTEMGILVALSLFSADRGQSVVDKNKIEDAQARFATMLEYECLKNKRKAEYPKLLLKLSDLRYLHHAFIKIISNESSEPILTPLLKEIWTFP